MTCFAVASRHGCGCGPCPSAATPFPAPVHCTPSPRPPQTKQTHSESGDCLGAAHPRRLVVLWTRAVVVCSSQTCGADVVAGAWHCRVQPQGGHCCQGCNAVLSQRGAGSPVGWLPSQAHHAMSGPTRRLEVVGADCVPPRPPPWPVVGHHLLLSPSRARVALRGPQSRRCSPPHCPSLLRGPQRLRQAGVFHGSWRWR